MFLDHIAKGLTFSFAYPNLYLKVDKDVILLTHGHYLEPNWCFMSEWLLRIAGKDLRIGESLDLKEMVSLNFPVNQRTCSGVGQSGKFADLVRELQREVKDGDYRRAERYGEKLKFELDTLASFPWYKFIHELVSDQCIKAVSDGILTAVKNSSSSRFDEKFISDPDVQRRFRNYLEASLIEMDDLREAYGIELGAPTRMIFGHTHEPIGWHDSRLSARTHHRRFQRAPGDAGGGVVTIFQGSPISVHGRIAGALLHESAARRCFHAFLRTWSTSFAGR